MYRIYWFDEDGNPQEKTVDTVLERNTLTKELKRENLSYGTENLNDEQYKIRHNNKIKKFDTIEEAENFKTKNNIEEYCCIERWTNDGFGNWSFQDYVEDYEEE